MGKVDNKVYVVVFVLSLLSSLSSAAFYVADANTVYLLDFNDADILTLAAKQNVVANGSIKDIAADNKGNFYVAYGSANPTQVSKYNATSLKKLYSTDVNYPGLSDNTFELIEWSSYDDGNILSKRLPADGYTLIGFFDDANMAQTKRYNQQYSWDYISADTGYLYLAKNDTLDIYQYNLSDGNLNTSIKMSYSIQGIKTDNQGYLYVATANRYIDKYDNATMSNQGQVDFGSGTTITDLAYDADDSYLYVITGGGTWRRIDTSTMTMTKNGALSSASVPTVIRAAGGNMMPDPITCDWIKDADLLLKSDFDENCVIDFNDFATFADDWLKSSLN